MKRLLFVLLGFFLTRAFAQQSPIAEKTAGMEKFSGYFNFYWDAKGGKIWLEIDKWNSEFLYVNSLPAGVGSNDIGLDRGQLGQDRVVKFLRTGPRVLLIQPNYSYRATSDDQDERKAVEDAFAQSVLWGFDVSAEEGSRVLVDASAFYLRDAHEVVGALRRANQGTFKLEASRSAFYLPRTKNFPQNTEVEATLTFVGDEPGGWVQEVTPTPQAITIRQHHSLIQLPDNKFKMRAFDPRAGFFGINYMDYATPIHEPIVKQFIARHRLAKKDPAAALSEPVSPIVYYLDRGTPEPVRSALLEGARWWNQAFSAAGYKDAFRVEMMPEGADMMDVRYNVIQWVHRSTRGWSYGSTVTDPRTGEIIKGHVSLGSLRVRQDFLIAEGLLAPYEDGKPANPEMEKMALARLRQLSAHEVGHTLGLSHNYISSTADRASVMDYPHPLVKIKEDGTPDLSDAYASGIGEWDKIVIAYGYQDLRSSADEKGALTKILTNAMKRGLIFLTDQDARPPGSAHPQTHLWDNGKNAVDELDRFMKVRAVALARFSENNIKQGAPMATLEEVLVPLYLGHRYQVEAASKVLGGMNYTFALRGDGQTVTSIVAPEEQRRALASLLNTLTPDALMLPERIVRLIPPRAYGYERHRELFRGRTGMTFDPLAPVEAAASHTISFILHPDRAGRLVGYNSMDSKNPGLSEVIEKLITATWKSPHGIGYRAAVSRVVDNVALYHIVALAASDGALAHVRAVASSKLDQLKTWLNQQTKTAKDPDQRAHFLFAVSQISQFQQDPKKMIATKPADPPPGQPIGMEQSWGWCDWE